MVEKKNVIAIIGILVASVGILVPIIMDAVKNKSQITVIKEYSSSLLTDNISLDKLVVEYKGKNVLNITKALFIIRNSGNVPILKSDILAPIEIDINNGKIIDSKIEKTIPDKIKIQPIFDDNKVIIPFDLLNPGDSLFLNILSDSGNVQYSCFARIKNISQIIIENASTTYKPVKDIDWLFFTILALTIFCFLGFFAFCFGTSKKDNEIVNNLNDIDYVNTLSDKNEFIKYIKTFSVVDDASKSNLREIIKMIINNWNEENKLDYINKILVIFEKQISFNSGAAIILFLLTLAGSYFCVRYFIQI